jgi:hypothetical protein
MGSKPSVGPVETLPRVDAKNASRAYVDPNSLVVGTTDPLRGSNDPQRDRAVFRLTSRLDATRPLVLPAVAPPLREGQEIFVVSRKPFKYRQTNDDKEPMMFHTTIAKLIPPWGGLPGGVFSDVDDIPGDSGSLYLVRDPNDPSRLIPVAIGRGAFEQTVDGRPLDRLPWSAFKNSAVAINLDGYYYDFPEQPPP